jgi:hypothetical protein
VSVEDDMHQEREYRQMMLSYQSDAAKLRAKFKPDRSGRYEFTDPALKRAVKGFGKGLRRAVKDALIREAMPRR